MKTYRIKLQRKVIYEATIEVEASSSMTAFDIAKKRIDNNDLPEFTETKHTEPKVSAVETFKSA